MKMLGLDCNEVTVADFKGILGKMLEELDPTQGALFGIEADRFLPNRFNETRPVVRIACDAVVMEVEASLAEQDEIARTIKPVDTAWIDATHPIYVFYANIKKAKEYRELFKKWNKEQNQNAIAILDKFRPVKAKRV